MAVRLEGQIKRFVGSSSDSKPAPGRYVDGVIVAAADLPAGSSFLESDTGKIYRWNGSEWAYPELNDDVTSLLGLMLDELRAIKQVLEDEL